MVHRRHRGHGLRRRLPDPRHRDRDREEVRVRRDAYAARRRRGRDLGGNAHRGRQGRPNTEAAAKFLAFSVQEDQMRTFCEATGQLPTLSSLTSAKLDFADPAGPDGGVRPAGRTVARTRSPRSPCRSSARSTRAAGRAGAGVPRRPVGGRHQGSAGRGGAAGRSVTAAPAVDPPRGTTARTRTRGRRDWAGPAFIAPAWGWPGCSCCCRWSWPSCSASPRSPALRAEGLGRAGQLRPDGHRPDVLPVGDQHGAVHRAHRAGGMGLGLALAVLLNSVLAGAAGSSGRWSTCRWSSPGWRSG